MGTGLTMVEAIIGNVNDLANLKIHLIPEVPMLSCLKKITIKGAFWHLSDTRYSFRKTNSKWSNGDY